MSYQFDPNRYELLKYNYCGKSGLKLPLISLGLWHNFGGVDVFENGRSMLRRAFDSGITHFDLANNYGPPPGSAEENFGSILKKDFKAYRDEMIISTKAGYKMWDGPYGDWGSRKYLLSSLDQSLKRMKLDYVDIFYSHRPDPETPIEETMNALAHAVKQGKTLYVGISNYSAEQTKVASILLRKLGTPCLIHQPSYSMFNRWVEDGLLEVVEKEGIGLIAFSPLAQGLLTDRYLKGIPEGSRASKPHGFLKQKDITEKKLRKIRELNDLAIGRGQSLAQMAIVWLLKDKRVTSVLIGASSVEQINNNLASFQKPEFSKEELKKINDVLSSDEGQGTSEHEI
jgi:L-glyceraldehyde 3-phosphate reductase